MTNPLKILHIVSSWNSGAGSELAAFAPRLAQAGFECEICVLARSNHRNIPNVPTTTLGLRWTFDVSTYLGVGRVLRRFRPDVIHVWDSTAHFYAAFHYGTGHILVEKREIDEPKNIFQRHCDKKTYRFIVPRRNDTLPTAKTVIIPPAAIPVPHSEPISTAELLKKLDFSLELPSGDYYPVFLPQYEPARRNYRPISPHPIPFLIGIVLPLRLEHRILDALWVCETLNHVHLNYHAFIIGEGKDRETFLRYRDRWQLFSRVHFLGNRHDTYRLLPCFDALLHLSSSAEYAGSILSAMSCGVPVVALETPESCAYILEGTTGALIPDNGDFRFYRRTAVKKLLYLLENEELRRSMQIAAKDRIAKEFNFDTAVQRRIGVYRELMGSSHERKSQTFARDAAYTGER